MNTWICKSVHKFTVFKLWGILIPQQYCCYVIFPACAYSIHIYMCLQYWCWLQRYLWILPARKRIIETWSKRAGNYRLEPRTGLQIMSVLPIFICISKVMAMEHLRKNNSFFSQLTNYVIGNKVCSFKAFIILCYWNWLRNSWIGWRKLHLRGLFQSAGILKSNQVSLYVSKTTLLMYRFSMIPLQKFLM